MLDPVQPLEYETGLFEREHNALFAYRDIRKSWKTRRLESYMKTVSKLVSNMF